jgi:hypothetical protein
VKAEKKPKGSPLDEALGPLAGKGASGGGEDDDEAEGSGVTPEEQAAFDEFESATDAADRALALKNFVYACTGG